MLPIDSRDFFKKKAGQKKARKSGALVKRSVAVADRGNLKSGR